MLILFDIECENLFWLIVVCFIHLLNAMLVKGQLIFNIFNQIGYFLIKCQHFFAIRVKG